MLHVSPGVLSRPSLAALTAIALLVIIWITHVPVTPGAGSVAASPAKASGKGRYVTYETISYPNTNSLRRIFTSRTNPPNPATQNTLLLTLTDDLASWGRMERFYHRDWTFSDYITLIRKQSFPPSNISFGLLTSSKPAFESYTADLLSLKDGMPWSSAEVIYLPDLPLPFDRWMHNRTERFDRNPEKQGKRRRYLARLRNHLASTTLKPHHEHIIWVDSDIWELPPGLFSRFTEIGSFDTGKDITGMVKTGLRPGQEKAQPAGLITLRSEHIEREDFDRNSWNGFGKRPSNWELDQILKKNKEFAGMEGWAKAIVQLLGGTTSDDLIRLDSVGASALYVKAELVREGLVFPAYSAVGTKWGEDGKEGVEVEGLCYLAERMGWGCYALGGRWMTKHSDL
ncbi:hypothetical protein AA313_de0208076 [Arthrobotrys entomopaga]|nr:hypothetical protein AA313_de0208076 [Arthrobotrys entomopaga]